MEKIIVHIDLNTFFVRCEEIRNPKLIGKPVAIGHEGRAGIVSTCSYEARHYRVCSGMAMFKAKELCPQLIVLPSDFHYYRALSKAFVNYVRNYTKLIEIASVDEVFADFSNVLKDVSDYESYFKIFQDGLLKETGLKCSIGIAPTKFLAKMGSDLKKPMGITVIERKDIKEKLYPLPIKDMFGVGKKTYPRLEYIGIRTIKDLAEALDKDNQEVLNIIGKFSVTLKEWINGYGEDEIDIEPFDPKSIGNSTTLPHDTDSLEEIKQTFKELAKEVSDRAKKENKVGTTVQIVVKDTAFKSRNKSISFQTPTNDSVFILNKALDLYEANFYGLKVRLIGVTLQNLIDVRESAIQMTFFDYEKHEEENKTRLIIDDLNRKLKSPMLKRASEVKKNGN